MKALIQTGRNGRMPVPPEKRFLISNRRHAPDAVQRRREALEAAGADGNYFFNFCCYGALGVLRAVEETRVDHEIVGKAVCS